MLDIKVPFAVHCRLDRSSLLPHDETMGEALYVYTLIIGLLEQDEVGFEVCCDGMCVL